MAFRNLIDFIRAMQSEAGVTPPSTPVTPQYVDAEGNARPPTPQEVMSSMPAGSTNYVDALRAMAGSAHGINGLQRPEVMSWLQQTQGFNPGVAGQVIAAMQGGYGMSDPYVQSILGWARSPSQEELGQGYQSVAQQLAGRGDTSLEQAVQAGFFNQFPNVDQNWLGQFIAGTQAGRDSGVVDQALRTAAPLTALPALAVGGGTAAGAVTGNINSSEDARNYLTGDAAALAAAPAVAAGLPALGLSTVAPAAGVETGLAAELGAGALGLEEAAAGGAGAAGALAGGGGGAAAGATGVGALEAGLAGAAADDVVDDVTDEATDAATDAAEDVGDVGDAGDADVDIDFGDMFDGFEMPDFDFDGMFDGLGEAFKSLGPQPGLLDQLMKIGVPAATIAGLFEKNESPLLGPITDAARASLAKAGEFGALQGPGVTPSQAKVIEAANANAGEWRKYFDKAGALADTGAAGITPQAIARYQNPYLGEVLDPAIRDIEEAADRRRQALRFKTARSGNDFRTPGANRFNIEEDLLDRSMLREIGDASGKLRAASFDAATGLAGKDLDRSLTASNLYGGMGRSSGALGGADIENLKTAGALERVPYEDQRSNISDSARLYSDVMQRGQGALKDTAPTSTLTNLTGALGTLKAAKDVGLY